MHFAHASRAKRGQDFVGTDARARGQRQDRSIIGETLTP
jgi:hypothetical protein